MPELTPRVMEVGHSPTEGGTDWPGHSATASRSLSGPELVFLQDAKEGALAGFGLPQGFCEQCFPVSG